MTRLIDRYDDVPNGELARLAVGRIHFTVWRDPSYYRAPRGRTFEVTVYGKPFLRATFVVST